nr:5-methyltetrahydropteroyltriglutamate--homocysteine S-methyltransferase [Evansella caseinilytica]
MTTKTSVAPFRADHVGSFLRPERLHKVRQQHKEGKASDEQLRQVENEEIKRIVDRQIELGLQAVTDGELRRRFFHTDFMEHLYGIEGYVPDQGYLFANGVETERYNVRSIDKIAFNPNHPHLQDFVELKQMVGGRAVPKMTIPSPNQFFNETIQNVEINPDIEEYAADIVKAYQDALQAFYNVGARYIQFDDVYTAGLCSPAIPFNEGKYDREYLIDLAIRVVNGALEKKPDDLIITTHLCRGNYRSNYAFSGGYGPVAPALFGREKVDGFFLEYDDERSGDFAPLKHIPEDGPRVVLGLVTSKAGQLEGREQILARIEEASKYVPLEQLCLSPQCGFASTHHGNDITEEEQWNKIKFVIDIAKEVWG